MESIVAVCNVYKLFKDGKRFTKESKKILRSNVVLLRSYVADKNAKWEQNGLWHVVDEQATIKYFEWGAKKVAKRRKAKETAKKLKEIFTDVLDKGSDAIQKDDDQKTDVQGTDKQTPKQEPKKEDENTDTNIDELQAVQEEYKQIVKKRLVGKYAKDIPWMKKKINEHKTK